MYSAIAANKRNTVLIILLFVLIITAWVIWPAYITAIYILRILLLPAPVYMHCSNILRLASWQLP